MEEEDTVSDKWGSESLVCLRRWIRCIEVREGTWRGQVTVDPLGGHHEVFGIPGGWGGSRREMETSNLYLKIALAAA